MTPHQDDPFWDGHIFLSLCSPRPQVLRKEQALSEDSGFLKEQMEKLLKVCASLNIHTLNILHTVVQDSCRRATFRALSISQGSKKGRSVHYVTNCALTCFRSGLASRRGSRRLRGASDTPIRHRGA